MRKDMNKVIIETGRHGMDEDDKGKSKYLTRARYEDFEEHPIRESISRWHRSSYRSQGDKLGPLRGYLRKHVGEKWNDVYSDICTVNDKRSLVGFHLLTHLEMEVNFPGSRSRRYGYQEYFVDTDGTLQEAKRPQWGKLKKKPVEEIALEDGSKYKLENGLWYHCWTETYLEPYSTEYLAEENGEVVIKRTPQKMFERKQEYKFQCGKKKLKWIRDWFAKRRM